MTTVTVGGLARTDQAGYGEEFARLAHDLAVGPDPRASAELAEPRARPVTRTRGEDDDGR